MKDTREFVSDVREVQRNAERNKKRQGQGNPGAKLPNKQHGTNK